MADRRNILIIDSDASFRRNARRFLSSRGYSIREAANGREALELLNVETGEFALVDLRLPDITPVELVRNIVQRPESPTVVGIVGSARVPEVVASIQAGASDVLERPVDGERLYEVLERCAREREHSSDSGEGVKRVKLLRPISVDSVVSESPTMRTVLGQVKQMAPRATALLVVGEPGVGKAGIARYFHSVGSRAEGPLISVSARDAQSVASEDVLFGGSDTKSAFAQAKGGVVYIDSLSALGTSGQQRLAKLLQGLSAGGAVRWPPMVIGSDRPLVAEVEAGRAPMELIRLLNQDTVVVPPLRDRREDLPELIRRVLVAIASESRAAGWSVEDEVFAELTKRQWPGNLPELIRTIQECAVYDEFGRVTVDLHVGPPKPAPVATAEPQPPAPREPELWKPSLDMSGRVQSYDIYEAEIFTFALKNAGGCVSRAAAQLGVGRATMYRKMRTYGIDVPPVSERAISRRRRTPPAEISSSQDLVS